MVVLALLAPHTNSDATDIRVVVALVLQLKNAFKMSNVLRCATEEVGSEAKKLRSDESPDADGSGEEDYKRKIINKDRDSSYNMESVEAKNTLIR